MVRDYTEQYRSRRGVVARTAEAIDGLPFGHAHANSPRHRQRVTEAWPNVAITDVDSAGLPDIPLLGSELTRPPASHWRGCGPTRSWCRACSDG